MGLIREINETFIRRKIYGKHKLPLSEREKFSRLMNEWANTKRDIQVEDTDSEGIRKYFPKFINKSIGGIEAIPSEDLMSAVLVTDYEMSLKDTSYESQCEYLIRASAYYERRQFCRECASSALDEIFTHTATLGNGNNKEFDRIIAAYINFAKAVTLYSSDSSFDEKSNSVTNVTYRSPHNIKKLAIQVVCDEITRAMPLFPKYAFKLDGLKELLGL